MPLRVSDDACGHLRVKVMAGRNNICCYLEASFCCYLLSCLPHWLQILSLCPKDHVILLLPPSFGRSLSLCWAKLAVIATGSWITSRWFWRGTGSILPALKFRWIYLSSENTLCFLDRCEGCGLAPYPTICVVGRGSRNEHCITGQLLLAFDLWCHETWLEHRPESGHRCRDSDFPS